MQKSAKKKSKYAGNVTYFEGKKGIDWPMGQRKVCILLLNVQISLKQNRTEVGIR